MSKDLQVFNWKDGLEIRSTMIEDEPWFIAKDVAVALGYKNPRDAVSKHVDEEDVVKRDTLTRGGNQELTYLNESGVYALIVGSRLPSAKQFKRWVTKEVLPSIRKHGAYMTPETIQQSLADPDFIIGLATKLKEEQEKSAELERTKAHISDKKTATAMNTASQKSKENEKLKQKLDESMKYASINRMTGLYKPKEKFRFKLLRDYCTENELKIKKVTDTRYPNPISLYPAEAWMEVYGLDVTETPFDE